MADVWANSMACHPRAICHTAGCCHLANSMWLFQSYVSHCRVLPPGEFNVVIPELRVTPQGAATGRIQWHVIPEPCITLQGAAWWIHCHDSRATCHIAGCSHLVKSMSWPCRIAGCNNFIRHIAIFLLSLIFLIAVWASTSGGFRVVSDTLVQCT